MEMIKNAGEWIKDCWAYIAALIGILGAVYKYLVQPVLKQRRQAQQDRDDYQRAMMGKIEGIGNEIKQLRADIDEVSTDVGYLQHDRLQQGHDHFMRLGYCSPGDKENLITMYDRYISRGRNSLYQTYKDDLLALPNTPEGNWGSRQKGGLKDDIHSAMV